MVISVLAGMDYLGRKSIARSTIMRLLSYNIHKGIGGRDRRYRLERVIQVIEDQNPDLICLQEVDRHVTRTRHDDQPRQLIEAFNAAAHLYQLNVRLKNGGYGNLLLSRWPLRSHHQVSLRLREKKPRGAQMAVVDSPEGSFHLVHWHLGLAERERHWQVRHLLDHHLFRQAAHLPTLIVGDFNDWRNTLAKGPFAAARVPPVDRAAIPLPVVPGLLAGDRPGQGLRARGPGHPPGPDRPLAAGSRRLRPPAPGDRFPPRPTPPARSARTVTTAGAHGSLTTGCTGR